MIRDSPIKIFSKEMTGLIIEVCIFLFLCASYMYYHISTKKRTLKMPVIFSLNEKYIEESLFFIKQLSKDLKKPIYIDCHDLKNISEEAYIIFIAKLEKESLQPNKNLLILNPKLLEKRLDTAYYAHKYSNIDEIVYEIEKYDDDNPENLREYLKFISSTGLNLLRHHNYNIRKKEQMPLVHENEQVTDKEIERSKLVDVNLIAEFTQELKSNIDIEDTFEPLYDLLVELIGNAAEHGIKNKNINWWIHRYSDVHTQSMHYVFVDMGGGIINSYKESMLLTKTEMNSEKDILLSALKGRLGSTTRQPGRGNGMPLILENIEKEWISNFFLITNSVSLRYIKGDFRILNTPFFIGTYYSWSISKNNYLQWKNSLSQ